MNGEKMWEAFVLPEGNVTAEPFGNGHINGTYLIRVDGSREEYILQRINGYVFPHPLQVMENIRRVTEYLREVIRREGGDPERETMRLVQAKDGGWSAADPEGNVWRVLVRVPDTMSPDLPDSPEMLEECGRAFGVFSRRLSRYPVDTLYETIPAFHNTPTRMRQLEEAAARDEYGRLSGVAEEMRFARERAERTRVLVQAQAAGKLPIRVTHNDTKVNNVLLDAHTGKAICVVDLDTVMPGLLAYDFGDAIRVGACSAEEDERDLSRVRLDLSKYEAFARGFIPQVRDSLSREELESLAEGAWMMTFENGVRFLADHLNGDKYFRIHREGQNLDRARAQFALAADMENRMDRMLEILLRL